MFGDFQPLFYVKIWFNIQLKTTIQNAWFFLGYQASACLPSFGPFRPHVGVVCKVLQLQVEIPRSCWSSGRSGKAEFCRWSVGVVSAGIFFCDFFFGGGFGKKTHQIFKGADDDYDPYESYDMMIWLFFIWEWIPMACGFREFPFSFVDVSACKSFLDDHPGSRFFS